MCSRCGNVIPGGIKCSCTTAYKKDYNKFRRDNKIKTFRSFLAWMRTREAVFQRDGGLDLYLLHTTGELVPGCSMHHIYGLSEYWSKRLDMENLITLSEETHGRIEYLYKTKNRTTKLIVGDCKKRRRGKMSSRKPLAEHTGHHIKAELVRLEAENEAATVQDYEKMLCKLIEAYDLNKFDVAGEAKLEQKPKIFQVKVTSDALRIRTVARTKYSWTRKYTGKGIFTITEEKNGWGKLKSGAGWISLTLDCVQKL